MSAQFVAVAGVIDFTNVLSEWIMKGKCGCIWLNSRDIYMDDKTVNDAR